jgi:hypothetical protein
MSLYLFSRTGERRGYAELLRARKPKEHWEKGLKRELRQKERKGKGQQGGNYVWIKRRQRYNDPQETEREVSGSKKVHILQNLRRIGGSDRRR